MFYIILSCSYFYNYKFVRKNNNDSIYNYGKKVKCCMMLCISISYVSMLFDINEISLK